MKKALLTLFIGTSLLSAAYAQINIDTSKIVKNDRQLYSVVVSQDDKVIYNQYFNGKSSDVLFNNQSLTKSVMSLLIGIAIDKGYISSVDEKLVKFFPQLKQDTDKRKMEITLREVMNQASGLWHEDLMYLATYLKQPDPSNYTLNAPLVSAPGKVFHYNNAASHLLSVIITKSTGMNTLDFANKYLFGTLGITDVKWNKMNDGYYDGSGLLSVQTHTQDMNKIASLLLHKGYFNGKSVVTEKWIKQILNPTVFYHTEWGFQGSTYALCWYHFNYNNTPVTYALGWSGQFAFVIPVKKAVITVNENINDMTAVKASVLFLSKIFPMVYKGLN